VNTGMTTLLSFFAATVTVALAQDLPIKLQYKQTHAMEDGCEITVTAVGTDGTSPDGRKLQVVMQASGQSPVTWVTNLDGEVTGSWVADLDRDSHEEVGVAISSFGTGAYGSLIALKQTDAGLRPFLLEQDWKARPSEYRGKDQFVISGQYVVRSYPRFRTNDPNCCPKAGARLELYSLTTYGFTRKVTLDVPGIESGNCLDAIDAALGIADAQGHGPEWWSAVRRHLQRSIEHE
jgi:hypothetical protein